MPNQIHTTEGVEKMEGIHHLKDGDIIVADTGGGFAVFRWRANRNPAAIGFEQDMDGALALAKRKQQQQKR
jgi:hypothetical protein